MTGRSATHAMGAGTAPETTANASSSWRSTKSFASLQLHRQRHYTRPQSQQPLGPWGGQSVQETGQREEAGAEDEAKRPDKDHPETMRDRVANLNTTKLK